MNWTDPHARDWAPGWLFVALTVMVVLTFASWGIYASVTESPTSEAVEEVAGEAEAAEAEAAADNAEEADAGAVAEPATDDGETPATLDGEPEPDTGE